jgi:C4-dicarboxylate transporter DctQ subunit
VTFAQVFFRFVIVHSLPWSEEFSRYSLVWATFLGASVALKRGLHIGVDAFVGRLPKEKRHLVYIFTLIIVVLFVLMIMIKGFQLAFFNMKQSSPAIKIPMGFPYLAIPIGALIMLIHLIDKILLSFGHKKERIY